MLSGIVIATVTADTWPSLPSTPVTMHVITGTSSYLITTLSNVPPGYDVSNGVYAGWCIDRSTTISNDTTHQIMLYSSLNPPVEFQGMPWDMVNYILNHKQGSMEDIQDAIWYFIKMDGIGWWSGSTQSATAEAIVADALANGSGYVPGAGEVVAVICDPTDCAQKSIIEVRKPGFPKQFTSSFGFCGFTAPEIMDGGLKTTVTGIHSGPRVSWNVTYYFANTEEFLGSQYDGEAHYFRLWDKWGGNLMALGSTPVAFDPGTNIVTLADRTSFEINYAGYSAYIGSGLGFTDSNGNPAKVTLHTGDQQENTNPGKGKGSQKDGASYDVDVAWEIGYLAPGQSATLTIVIAPGKNPGGRLAFSSCGFEWINTGPRTRVYSDAAFADFLYAIDNTIQLGVTVVK
ncbi:hypothetical protein G4O51_04265 [Candidatus Bathyarchaeota archaeon A05DMB-2]|jgi:hypothetical protein|nr:hypothetical protein [Candidatus Bathyarchaeota archaeon A05DMB-2]